jgi:hypothetical protein
MGGLEFGFGFLKIGVLTVIANGALVKTLLLYPHQGYVPKTRLAHH